MRGWGELPFESIPHWLFWTMQRWLYSHPKEKLNCNLKTTPFFFLSISFGPFIALYSHICSDYQGSNQQDLFQVLKEGLLNNLCPSCGSPRPQIDLLQPSFPSPANQAHSSRRDSQKFTKAAQCTRALRKKPRFFSSAGSLEELQLYC